MSDSTRDLHGHAYDEWQGDAYGEWRDERADKFARLQRRAFLAGFEAAANESEDFWLLRQWLEKQRTEAVQQYNEPSDKKMYGRQEAFKEVLEKLSEMGCHSDDNE